MVSLLSLKKNDAGAIADTLEKSLAIAIFDTSGNFLSANEKFCALIGYNEADLVKRNQSEFLDPSDRSQEESGLDWGSLNHGESRSKDQKYTHKDGSEVWIRASCHPALSKAGQVLKVTMLASDITDSKCGAAENEAKVAAISKTQALIEFDLDGTILTANENFCRTMGYTVDEIVGRNHSMFLSPSSADSQKHHEFWSKVVSGEVASGDFQRVGKSGKDVWVNASYVPMCGMDGKPYKVVEFATDITDRMDASAEIGSVLASLAAGDLTALAEHELSGDLEKIRVDLNSAIDHVATIFTKISHSTQSLETGIQEIVSASDDLSQRTEKQAASLEESAATLSQIAETVKKSSEGAENTQIVVKDARKEAENSEIIVEQALGAMTDIETSAKEISQIISVIDEIAFQTNLLALNAGVEAARAGDAGQGFAVVASEVRALAQRSAVAAKEIKDLISKSTDQVSNGSRLVGETGETLKKIANQVIEISTVVDEIADGAKAQSRAIGELNIAVGEMDSGTQRNAAMAEQATAAAHSLRNEASELTNLTGEFKISPSDPDPIVSSTPVPVNETHEAMSGTSSPANELVEKVSSAFVGSVDGNAAIQDDWEEF